MIANKRITLVIPCRNEELAIAQMLRNLPQGIDEVLVIDNNSTDKTRDIARQLGARVIKETRQYHGIGYGYAHQSGIKQATGDIVITLDGDNTYPLSAIPKIIKHMIKHNLEFVSCNRFPLTDSKAISGIRQLGVWILNTEVKILYNYPMQDILSGMWAMDRRIAKKLRLREGGWNLSPEIKLAALNHPKIAFGEYHIHHRYRYGESKQVIWKTGFEHLWYIAQRRLTTDNTLYRQLKRFKLDNLQWRKYLPLGLTVN